MKKILLFIDCLSSGGAQRQLVGLAVLLKQAGYSVKVYTYFGLSFYDSFLNENNVEHEVVEGAENRLFRIPRVIRAFKRYNPDVVIAYLDTPSIIACIGKLLGARWKLIVSERNTSQSFNRHERVKFLFYKLAKIIVPNSYSQESFIKRYIPSLLPKVYTITNFVETEIFKPATIVPSYDLLEMVVVGRISPQKNPIRFFEAIAKVKEKGYKLNVKWYGRSDSNILEECKRKITELGISDIFSFKEPTQNIIPIYQQCDIFCLPSLYEGFPNVLCEAMCCGKPVVVSRVCDNPKIVKDGENGLMFNPLDVDEMANTIMKMVSMDKDKLLNMGRISREIAVKSFSKDLFLNKYIELIEKE